MKKLTNLEIFLFLIAIGCSLIGVAYNNNILTLTGIASAVFGAGGIIKRENRK